jgi:hypothetical protein
MMQTELMFSMPRPGDLFTAGSQNYRLYERLLMGSVTNAEIVRDMGIFNSTGRASDIRKVLRPHLMDIKATRIHDGLFEYTLKGRE